MTAIIRVCLARTILPGVFLDVAFADFAFLGLIQLVLTAGVQEPLTNGDNGIPLDCPCNFFCHLGIGPDDMSVMVQDFRHSLIPASKVLGSMKATVKKELSVNNIKKMAYLRGRFVQISHLLCKEDRTFIILISINLISRTKN